MKPSQRIFVGIDLSAKPSNPTGWALLKGSTLLAQHLFTDKEIVAETIRHTPKLTAIDAPLSLPKNKREYMRKADKEMHRRGYPVLPPRFESMEKLTLRAAKLTLQLQREGFAVIEVHPLSAKSVKYASKKLE